MYWISAYKLTISIQANAKGIADDVDILYTVTLLLITDTKYFKIGVMLH